MQGRLEHKIKTETSIQDKLPNMPEYMKRYYHFVGTKSHTTKLRYMSNIDRYLLHEFGTYPKEKDIKNIDSYAIQKYMSEIQYYDKNGETYELKESTKCNIYSSLSSFFTFLTKMGYIDRNPFADKMIERPKITEGEIVYLTPQEVRKFEATIIEGVGSELSKARQAKWKYRDVLLFRIPVVNGLRLSALDEINIEDIDLDNDRIRVTEKGNITKWVSFDMKTASYLAMWLVQREKLLGDKKCNALFISNRRTRMDQRSIENIIDKYAVCITGKHITPHKLRSTCATNTYQAKKDIYLTSKVLGHKTTAPTRRYAAVFNEDITNVINEVANMY